MGTIIRSELSKNNPHYLEKHRYLELKHFCLQYPNWSHELEQISFFGTSKLDYYFEHKFSDPTNRIAETRMFYTSRMDLIKSFCKMVDPVIGDYIFKGVTQGLGYEVLNPPCGKELYYKLYRKFFWALHLSRE